MENEGCMESNGCMVAARAGIRPPLDLSAFMQTGLRVVCLSAALGLNSSLRTLELSGWTWTELGNGCALPFLTLGSMAGSGALTTVKAGHASMGECNQAYERRVGQEGQEF